VTLTATGATSYTWNKGANVVGNGNSIAVTVTVTGFHMYGVTGVSAEGCSNTSSVSVIVNACNAIGEIGVSKAFHVYPNPSSGQVTILGTSPISLTITDELGRVIRTIRLSASNEYRMTVDHLAAGVYFVVGNDGLSRERIVVTK
jgi:hypothetical protein